MIYQVYGPRERIRAVAGARYYSAWTCRFISVDALAKKYNQLTPYQNAGNNPINDRDIDGNKGGKTPKGGGGEKGGKGDKGKNDQSSDGNNDSPNTTTENTEAHGGEGESIQGSKDSDNEMSNNGESGMGDSGSESNKSGSELKNDNNNESNNSDSLNIPKGDVPTIDFEDPSTDSSRQATSPKTDINPMPTKPAPDVRPKESTPDLAQNNSPQPQSGSSTENKKPWGIFKELVGGLIQRFNSLIQESDKTLAKASKLAKFSAKAAKGVPIIGFIVAAVESYFIFRKEGNSFKGYWKSALAITVAFIGLIPFVGLAVGVAYAYADYKGYVDQWANRAEKNFNHMRNEFNKGMNALFEHPWRMFPR